MQINHFARYVGFVVLAVLASACQTIPSQPYNKAANTNIKNVGIAPIGSPDQADVRILAPAGANFGLIGALVEEGRAAEAGNEFKEILASASYDFNADLRASLASSLSKSGFAVTPPSGERPIKEKTKFLAKCTLSIAADACLDVYVNYIGYMAAGPKTDYLPTVHVTARLVRVADGALLFQDQIQHNPTFAGSKAIVVQSSTRFGFADRKTMQADPKRVAEGLKEAVHAVADELAKQLR